MKEGEVREFFVMSGFRTLTTPLKASQIFLFAYQIGAKYHHSQGDK